MLVYILFITGFVLLVKGADLFINGASSIAKKLKVSDLTIGLTVVAFGTSAPELFVNLFASAEGHTQLAIGNVLGSNIANILLILGISAIIYSLSVKESTVKKEIPFSLIAALVLVFLVNDVLIFKEESSALSRIDALILLTFFIIFIYYTFGMAKKERKCRHKIEFIKSPYNKHKTSKALLILIIGFVGLNIGAIWVVDGAVELAGEFGLSKALIGLTIVAVGTSLPELATSAMAAYKKNSDIAVGNIVGSNIFNIFLILGVSALIRPLLFESRMNLDLGVIIFASLLLFIFMFTGRKRNLLERWEGAIFVALYISFIIFSVLRG